MGPPRMEQFWDARARENAFYFVDSRLAYSQPDQAAFWAGGEDSLDRLLAAVDAPALAGDEIVVDIGCGLGRLTRPLAARASHVLAVDVSGEMLRRAQALNAHLGNVEWLHGDGESLRPIEDASVDACVSHVVFRHIPDPAIILAYVIEIGRVLRPGGFAAFEFSNAGRPHVHEFRERFGRLAALAGRAPRGVTDASWTGSSVALSDLGRAATQAGLGVASVTGEGTQFCAVRLVRAA